MLNKSYCDKNNKYLNLADEDYKLVFAPNMIREESKHQNLSEKIAKDFICKIVSESDFEAGKIRRTAYALALALSGIVEPEINLRRLRRSLIDGKGIGSERLIAQKLFNNLTFRENFTESEVKKITDVLYKSINYSGIINAAELIQHIRAFVKAYVIY